jgi:hypothetical protein
VEHSAVVSRADFVFFWILPGRKLQDCGGFLMFDNDFADAETPRK